MKFKIFNVKSEKSNPPLSVQTPSNMVDLKLKRENFDLTEYVRRSSLKVFELSEKSKISEELLAEKVEENSLADEQIGLLNAELNKLEMLHESSRDEILQLNLQIDAMDIVKKTLNGTISSLSDDLEEEKKKHRITEDKLKAAYLSNDQLNEQLLLKDDDLSNGLTMSVELKNQIVVLKEDLADMEAKYWKYKELAMIADEDKAANLKLKGSIKDLNNELRTLKSQLKASEEASAGKMIRFCQVLESQIDVLEESLRQMETEYNTMVNRKCVKVWTEKDFTMHFSK